MDEQTDYPQPPINMQPAPGAALPYYEQTGGPVAAPMPQPAAQPYYPPQPATPGASVPQTSAQMIPVPAPVVAVPHAYPTGFNLPPVGPMTAGPTKNLAVMEATRGGALAALAKAEKENNGPLVESALNAFSAHYKRSVFMPDLVSKGVTEFQAKIYSDKYEADFEEFKSNYLAKHAADHSANHPTANAVLANSLQTKTLQVKDNDNAPTSSAKACGQHIGESIYCWPIQQMPIILVLSMSALLVFAVFQHEHAQNFRGASRKYHGALIISALLAFVALTALFVYFFFHVAWYWPLALFAAVTALGGLLYGLVKPIVPFWVMSLVGFVAWPLAAIVSFVILHSRAS